MDNSFILTSIKRLRQCPKEKSRKSSMIVDWPGSSPPLKSFLSRGFDNWKDTPYSTPLAKCSDTKRFTPRTKKSVAFTHTTKVIFVDNNKDLPVEVKSQIWFTVRFLVNLKNLSFAVINQQGF